MEGGEPKEDADSEALEPRGQQETTNPPTSRRRLVEVMHRYGREVCFLLAVIFTAFAALQTGPLKTRKTSPPTRFFNSTSLVEDFYFGELRSLHRLLLENDVSVVLYYAPWDSASIQVREQFEDLANHLHSQVYFAAVNCWWPEGECHRTYKIRSFPAVLAHIRELGDIQYRGPLLFQYLSAFLRNVLNPLMHLTTPDDYTYFLSKHRAVTIGFFVFTSPHIPRGYLEFYQVSLQALNEDPLRNIGYGIISNKKTALNLKVTSSITLHQWNSTQIYQGKTSNSGKVLNWIYKNYKPVARWMSPSGVKSDQLSRIIEDSSTILLFTPRFPSLDLAPNFNTFEELAIDYYNCNNSQKVNSLLQKISETRAKVLKQIKKQSQTCAKVRFSQFKESKTCEKCCQTVNFNLQQSKLPYQRKCVCSACLLMSSHLKKSCPRISCAVAINRFLNSSRVGIPQSMTCPYLPLSYRFSYSPFYEWSVSCLEENNLKSELSLETSDDRIEKFESLLRKEWCQLYHMAVKHNGLAMDQMSYKIHAHVNGAFTGLGCRTNRTLKFVTLDSLLYSKFAENLGVRAGVMDSVTVIFEAKQEMQYLLKGKFTQSALVDFIQKYTAKVLSRHLRSLGDGFNGCSNQKGEVCIVEVTSHTFTDIVLNSEKDVLLFFYAPWCGFCQAVYHHFLAAANIFEGIDELSFARINADTNDLPWEYTVNQYPSILFFPFNRKPDSIKFPAEMQISPVSLIYFILVSAQTSVRWKLSMLVCKQSCLLKNLRWASSRLTHLFIQFRSLRSFVLMVQEYLPTSGYSHYPLSNNTLHLGGSVPLGDYYYQLVKKLHHYRSTIRRARTLQRYLIERLKVPFKNSDRNFTRGILLNNFAEERDILFVKDEL